MKHMYSLLFVISIVLGCNVYGMEITKIEYQDISSGEIFQRVCTLNLIDGFDFDTLLENVKQVNTVIKNITDKTSQYTEGDFDTLLCWLQVFDDTNDAYEKLLADTLDMAIKAKGKTNGMQPWECLLVQKGQGLQGLGKGFISKLEAKNQQEKEARNQLRANAELRKDQVATQFFRGLVTKNEDALDTLFENELFGEDALLGGHRNYIYNEVKNRLTKSKNENKAAFLDTWKHKFSDLETKKLNRDNEELERMAEEDRRIRKAEEQRRRDLEEQQRLDQLEQERRQAAEQARKDEKQRQEQLEKNRRIRDEQQRQYEEQKRLQKEENQRKLEQKNNNAEQRRRTQDNQPPLSNPDDGDLRPPVETAAAFISAPAGAITAVVVIGVCYWIYTKYKAYKANQAEEQEKQDNDDRSADI
jgi:hypothetical protein